MVHTSAENRAGSASVNLHCHSCYNEAANLRLEVLDEIGRGPGPPLGLVIADDGSSDGLALCGSLQRSTGACVFALPHRGKPAVLRRHLRARRHLLFTDMGPVHAAGGDGEAAAWFERGYEVVISSRAGSSFRWAACGAAVPAWLVGWCFCAEINDTQCSQGAAAEAGRRALPEFVVLHHAACRRLDGEARLTWSCSGPTMGRPDQEVEVEWHNRDVRAAARPVHARVVGDGAAGRCLRNRAARGNRHNEQSRC